MEKPRMLHNPPTRKPTPLIISPSRSLQIFLSHLGDYRKQTYRSRLNFPLFLIAHDLAISEPKNMAPRLLR